MIAIMPDIQKKDIPSIVLCSSVHIELISRGMNSIYNIFQIEYIDTIKFLEKFTDKLSTEERKSIQELFRSMKWWKPTMWESCNKTLESTNEEGKILYKVCGFTQTPSVSPPVKIMDRSFYWGILKCVFKKVSTESSRIQSVLCIELDSSWYLKQLDERYLYEGHFALAFFDDDFIFLKHPEILINFDYIERDSAADMCILLNAIIACYNTSFRFDYKKIKLLGRDDAELELFGYGTILQQIIDTFIVFRSLLPESASKVGIYQFLKEYKKFNDEEKTNVCITGNILLEFSRTISGARSMKFPSLESRRCINCLLPADVHYQNYSELSFCGLECFRKIISSVPSKVFTLRPRIFHL